MQLSRNHEKLNWKFSNTLILKYIIKKLLECIYE